ncbi:MAG: hypothetical protein KatS3mg019_1990 [Fimbriimonadales bacterium]|nr:MAG: hypothetical protein KatS3mg019_1990 [Fimbriimonadales bacterium]
MPLVVDDLSDLTGLLEQHEEWQLPLLRLLLSKKNVRELLVQDTELLLILRGLIVGEELWRLPAQVEEVKQIALQGVQIGRQALQAAQGAQQTAQQALQAAQQAQQAAQQAQQTAQQGLQRLDKVEADVAELKATTSELKATTSRIEARQRGDEGRRRGEELEKRVRRQAFRLLGGGEGGTPDDAQVQARLREWFAGRFNPRQRIRDIDDPSLADLIWWKGARVAIVEVSVQVNGEDVRRARLRAETLRQVGVDALPIVIGEEWATPDSRELAEQEGVAWKVGDELSQTFIAFCALDA